MKFTLSHLKQFLLTEKSLEEIIHALTDIGLEVEDVTDHQKSLKSFEIVEIISALPHPDADKLKICQVQTKNEILQIVCGASNAREGLKTVLASVGSEIPNGKFKIKASKIRGVESNGMLCSLEELCLSKSSEGIIELSPMAIIGNSYINEAGLNDPVININVTANRGDALGVYGIARDLSAKGLGELKKLDIPKINSQFNTDIEIINDNKISCPLFLIIEIKNIANVASPFWLQNLLENGGIKSISAVVDITNYLCLTFGQPLHAYDKAKLSQHLRIKSVTEEVIFEALDNKPYILTTKDIVIQDSKNIQCLAGIIGGLSSSCNDNTTNIILEAAVFNAESIAKTGRRLQLQTDARFRFERNVDQNFTVNALKIAASMIVDICGGEFSQISVNAQDNFEPIIIEFPIAFFKKLAGFEIPKLEVISIFSKLGCLIADQSEILNVTIPSWRHDLSVKEDLVEELLRIHGFNNIPEIPLPSFRPPKILSLKQRFNYSLKRLLAGRGFNELITWSFMNSKDAGLFSSLQDDLFILNPISVELNYMRPSILPNLLTAAKNNIERSNKDLAFFEIGPVFNGIKADEELVSIVGIRSGNKHVKTSHSNARLIDVYDIKADLEKIFAYSDVNFLKLQISPQAPSYYHPTRSATLSLGKNIIAYFGEIHPKILKHFDIEEKIVAFELNLSNLPTAKAKFGNKGEFTASNYPKVSRDFAFTVSDNQPVGEILAYVRNIDPKLIRGVNLFDVYTGSKIDANLKSIAFNITIQSDQQTLTDQEITFLCNKIIENVAVKFAAKLRS